MKRKFHEWLLRLWFTSYEGFKIRDGWKEQERERIVKLLSDKYGYCSANDAPEHEECYGWIEEPIYKVIAVIRGEDID